MARKEKKVAVPDFPGTENRDKDKVFQLTEWSAARAENWLFRMMLAYNRSGGQIPLELSGIGWEGLAVLAINTFLRGNIVSAEIVPLWDELLECVAIIRDPRKHMDVVTPFEDEDTQEVATRIWLRLEVLSLHVGFSVTDALSSLYQKIMAAPISSDIPTSPPA